MFVLTPKQVHSELLHVIPRGLTAMIHGSPGISKSALVQDVARQYKLKLIDVRLSQCTPEDLNGFPMRNGDKAQFTPFDIWPLDTDEIPDGYDGWLVFLDEITSAHKSVQAAAYKLILDRMVGSCHLNDNVAIVAAGNLATDKAVVNQMSTALQSRMVHFEMQADQQEWLEWAYRAGIDHRVTGFIEYRPSNLMDFRPDHNDKTFPCPRTWDMVSRLVKDEPIDSTSGPRIAGTIGVGMANEFITFAEEFERLPRYSEIVKAPDSVPVPPEMSTKYATISMLAENLVMDDVAAVMRYIDRFDKEMKVIFGRAVEPKNPDIIMDPSFRNVMIQVSRFAAA